MSGLGFPVMELVYLGTTSPVAPVIDEIDGFETTFPVAHSALAIDGSTVEPEPCSCTTEVTVTRLDATHIRLDFADPVLLIPPLTWPGSYTLDPVLTVFAVAPGAVTEAGEYDTVESVTLTTSEQGPFTYEVTIFGLEVEGA